MGSQQFDESMQLEDTMDNSWTEAAYEAVRDISAALQSSRDDLHPMDDAPSYQVLCGTARQAWCQAESSISTQQGNPLQPKELDCLCQLSTTTLQLSLAVCCDPSVALPLISSGTHTAALDHLKGAVKSLTNLWTACMAVLHEQKQQQHAHNPQHSSSTQQAWQGMIPSLSTSLKHLLHMSITSAEFVSSSAGSSSGSQHVPKEMCSMSALNLSWANMTRLLVAIPEGVRMQVLAAQDLVAGLQCALQQLHAAVMDLPVQARDRQEVLVRFWLQSVSRLTSAAWDEAVCPALQPLLRVTLDVYDAMVQQRQEFEAVQDILQQLLQPRLLACVSSLLSSSTNPAAFQDKLDILLQHTPLTPAQQDSGCHPQQALQQQQQAVKAQVYLVLDILQGALPTWPPELIATGCKHLLCWTISTTGQDLGTCVLGGTMTDAAAAASSGQVAQGGSSDSGLELMQSVLQGCLVSFVVCWVLLQEMQQQQLELLAAINVLALSSHPLVAFLARQLLSDCVAAAGSSELVTQQLGLLHRLFGASAAVAAVPGASWSADSRQSAEAVVDLLAAVLQACGPAFTVDWIKQHMMVGLGSSSNSSSSSSSWLDAGACSLLVQECSLLQRLLGTSPQLMPVSQSQVEEAWTQLWSTAQQVAELLEPCQLRRLRKAAVNSSSSGDGDIMCQQQAETLLVLQQLTWLFTAMQSVLELYSMLDATAAGALKQGVVSLALDVLAALADAATHADASRACKSSSSSTSSAAAAAAAQSACTEAALKLLAVPGQLQLPDSKQHEVLSVLRGAAECQEGLHVVLAGVLGNLGCAAKSGNPVLQDLFKQLLSSHSWATKHACLEALLQLMRHGSLGTGIVRLLPPDMLSSDTAAKSEVVDAVKSHLQRRPYDQQGQAAFVQQWPQLALQSMQQLHPAHTAAQGRTSLAAGQQLPNRSCTCLPDPDSIIRRTQRLQQLLAACGTVGAGPGGLQHPAAAHAGQGLLYADGAGGAQAILAQAATAAESLKSAEQALHAAESDVQLLLSAASAAARDYSIGAEGILLVSKQSSSLMGNVASMISRLRALQDGLSTLRS